MTKMTKMTKLTDLSPTDLQNQIEVFSKIEIKGKEEGFGIGAIFWTMALTIAISLLFAWLGARLDQSPLFFMLLGAVVGGTIGVFSSMLFGVMYTRTPEYQGQTFNNLIQHYFPTPFLFYLHLNELVRQPKFRRLALLIYIYIIADAENSSAILSALAEEMNRLQQELFPERKTDWTKLDDDKREQYMDTLNRLRKEKGSMSFEVTAIKRIIYKYREKFPIIDEFVPLPQTLADSEAQTARTRILNTAAFLAQLRPLIADPKFTNLGEGIIQQETDGHSVASIYDLPAASDWMDYTLQAEFTSDDNDQWGLMFRVQDDRHFYMWQVSQKGWGRFLKFDSGSPAVLGRDEIPIEVNIVNGGALGASDDWHEYKVEVAGNTFRGYVDDKLIAEVKDGAFPRGTVGIHAESQIGRIRNIRLVVEPESRMDSPR